MRSTAKRTAMNWKALPKAELHCHLGGIPGPGLIREIRQQDPTFPIDPDLFERAYPVRLFHRTFAQFHHAGLKIGIHTGELCGPEKSYANSLASRFQPRLRAALAMSLWL
jgi:adenosine deaminase